MTEDGNVEVTFHFGWSLGVCGGTGKVGRDGGRG